ncbi:hypothetical protein SODALDRAFT_356907 [Sodiomyces alkalinus F11]|uniref:Uncharacterized protein n=1 Tax=Sodiomyces alkalinus (strain CBS 110278 / VKM F-3762 / F11) TaxID=1314773 RepID=A0A3N2Q2D7_SODAK|nr:hypothetical protein SODALDRAFT_356907 [Sodiomyces alkalinus F11]ROT40886.1 hypothetical protein SODALDRAFT_356907 [Sodiomyces alkalinus F11]
MRWRVWKEKKICDVLTKSLVLHNPPIRTTNPFLFVIQTKHHSRDVLPNNRPAGQSRRTLLPTQSVRLVLRQPVVSSLYFRSFDTSHNTPSTWLEAPRGQEAFLLFAFIVFLEQPSALECGSSYVPSRLMDFRLMYRAKKDGPVLLGWKHPWEH